MNNYSKEELVKALKEIEEQYPAVYRNFFQSILEKHRDSLREQTPSQH